MILTASEFIELGEKYGYKVKYFDDGYYWLMPGDRYHFIAHYQKCNDDTHYIQVARDFEYDEDVDDDSEVNESIDKEDKYSKYELNVSNYGLNS